MKIARTALSLLLILSLTLTALPFPAAALSATEDSLISGPITETPIAGGQLVEPALNWEYEDDESRPHVVVEATTPTVSTMATTDPSDVSLNYTQVAADEGYSFELTATTAQSGQSVTWASADPAVASVTPTGDTTALVTSLRAGETAITATLDNGDVAVCTVYATISDGVYYIGTSGLFLGLDGSLKEYMPMKMLAKQTTGPAKIRQLWKIHYYGSGSVSVRSMYKLDMGLYSSDDNVVSITTVGTGTEVPNANRWTIVQEDAGYVFRHVGTVSKSMCVASGSFSPGARVITAVYSTTNASFCWTLTQDTSIANQVLLINTKLGLPAQNAVRYVFPGETLTLADMNLTASFVSQYTNTQDIRWLAIDDSQEKIVRVNSSTGAVTGVAGGQTTITVKTIYNGIAYSKNYTLVVLPVGDGTYYIRSRQYNRYMQVCESDAPNYSTSGKLMEQWAFDGGTQQKWTLTFLDNGYYKIISAKSGLALSIPSGLTAGENVSLTQETYTGLSRQQWQITRTVNGSCKIKARSSEDQDIDLAIAVSGGTYSNVDGAAIVQIEYTEGASYQDEWLLCTPFDMAISTDNYSGNEDRELESYRYANVFYDTLINPSDKGPMTKTHRYNKDSTTGASVYDFQVNGAISNNIDFMIYLGHGHSAHNAKGNHIQYSYSTDGFSDYTNICANSSYDDVDKATFCFYTSEAHFGSPSSDLRWVWMYTCNFLHAKEDDGYDYNSDNDNDYVTNAMLVEMMTGAHIVMGYASQSYLCDPMAEKFAEYLRGGETIIRSYFQAGRDGEASATGDHHIQKILYIPQAEHETIYSPPVHYEYDASDVVIITSDIRGDVD